MSGLDSALAVSMTPAKRSFLFLGSSISASDAGRLSRSRRSEARLLRLEISVRTAKMPATSPAKTSSGITSARPTSAKIIVIGASPSVFLLDLDVDDLADDQRADDLGDDGEDAHLLAEVGL